MDRCREPCDVMQTVFCEMLYSSYCMNFDNVGSTALDESVVLFSSHVVRCWLSTGFVGQSRQSLAVFFRHCTSMDMQVVCLEDASRSIPSNQLVNGGVEDEYSRFATMLVLLGGLTCLDVPCLIVTNQWFMSNSVRWALSHPWVRVVQRRRDD